MKKTLYQRQFLRQKWFELTDEGLHVRSRNLTKGDEYFTRFEDLGVKVIKSKTGKRSWLIASIIFILLSVVLFFHERAGGDTEKNVFVVYLILSIMCAVVYGMTFKNSFYLATNNNDNAVEFLVDKPSQGELKLFIEGLKEERKNWLLKKYGSLNKLVSYEQQLNTLNWLNNVEALTKEEYEFKLEELNHVFTRATPIVGFSPKQE